MYVNCVLHFHCYLVATSPNMSIRNSVYLLVLQSYYVSLGHFDLSNMNQEYRLPIDPRLGGNILYPETYLVSLEYLLIFSVSGYQLLLGHYCAQHNRSADS